jgi:hypothetical protein
MTDIKQFENIALSNYDILKLLKNKCKIVLYPDLHKYHDIDQLFDKNNCCIILYEAKPRYGHWCVLIKFEPNSIEFFNPYGGLPDNSLDYIDPEFRIKNNEFIPYLSQLMYNSPYHLFYNEFQFQKKSPDIKTCGRHCVVRSMNRKMDIYQYKNMMDKLRKKLKTDYDGVVTLFTI